MDSRIPDETATSLLTALRQALAAASRRPGVSRIEITIDATATLPKADEGVRLTVRDDGGMGTTVTWEAPV